VVGRGGRKKGKKGEKKIQKKNEQKKANPQGGGANAAIEKRRKGPANGTKSKALRAIGTMVEVSKGEKRPLREREHWNSSVTKKKSKMVFTYRKRKNTQLSKKH